MSSAQGTVRRLIVYSLLFALVTIAAIGVAGLLERLLGVGTELVFGSTVDLARSLAFALIGGPLAAVLWWSVWRRLHDGAERASLGWGLYLTAMYTVALIVATSMLVGTAASLVDDAWRPGTFAAFVVWALVWVWHRWMWRHPVKHPVRLQTVPAVAGSVFGLVVGAGGAVNALGALFGAAIRGISQTTIAGSPWWQLPVDGLIWAVAGAAIWWWHWHREGAKRLDTGLASVTLVVVGVMAAGLLMLGGLGTSLWVGLRIAFDAGASSDEILRPLGAAIASALVGATVWTYHRRIAAGRSDGTRRASMLVMSGAGLVGAATGIGIIVNSVLAALVDPFASSDTRSLLLGGISALVVGGPVWWFSWRPTERAEPAEIAYPGRRIYLVAVFGLSAIVALITLLVVGFQLFAFGLASTSGASLIDQIRAPLGLLVATVLVFGYHFAVWRRDRSVIAAAGPAPEQRVGRVILVAGGETTEVEQAIRATGASVTLWRRADVAAGTETEHAAEPEPPIEVETAARPDPRAIVAALDGVAAKRVLVIAGPGDRVEVIRLAD
ncbi:hypothetical protein BJY17_002266 [Agromyces hippuratus]|uniref:DUF5671 domain-containing protein n=1 Tax=Agromyces hippuratus TaxID=286438 RepID=A0A852WUA6_9MICO|nr:DUF5671 domain-containing protein [Agromyces hippuratus]NYG21519.1 hypothetical protein [Agromyces hippuratus]